MLRCHSILRLAVALLFKVHVGDVSGVRARLYRFSRSRRVFLYKLIGGNDRRYVPFSSGFAR
jgi:hypothetical protein